MQFLGNGGFRRLWEQRDTHSLILVFAYLVYDSVQFIIRVKHFLTESLRHFFISLDLAGNLKEIVTGITKDSFAEVYHTKACRRDMLTDNGHFCRIVQLVRMQQISFLPDSQVFKTTIRPLLVYRKVKTIARPIGIRKGSMGRIDHIIIPVGIANLIAQRLKRKDIDGLADEIRKIDCQMPGIKMLFQPFFEQFKKGQHSFLSSTYYEMDVIAHQFKGDNPDARTVKSTHTDNRHSDFVVLLVP